MTTVQIRSYPERFIAWVPLPNWLTLLLFWEGVFLLDYVLAIGTPGGELHLKEFGCLLFFFACVCISMIYCSKVLLRLFPDILIFIDHNDDELRTWYEARLRRSY